MKTKKTKAKAKTTQVVKKLKAKPTKHNAPKANLKKQKPVKKQVTVVVVPPPVVAVEQPKQKRERKPRAPKVIVIETVEVPTVLPQLEILPDVQTDPAVPAADVPLLIEPEPELTPEQKEKEEKKKAAKSARMYFNANTQAAIVKFQTLVGKKERDQLYVKEILPAFEKLVENLINIHKFTSLHDTYEDMKNDCVNFLFETIGKFDGNRGTNAFSYFNVVAKNWLIIRTKQKAQRMKRSISLDDPDSMSANEHRIIEDHNVVPGQDIVLENESTAKNIIKLLYEIRTKVKSENELKCINSIITIFENINDVDMLNKSAVLVYMRELSDLSPKQLTTTLQNIKKQYRRLKIDPKFRIW